MQYHAVSTLTERVALTRRIERRVLRKKMRRPKTPQGFEHMGYRMSLVVLKLGQLVAARIEVAANHLH